MTEESELIRAHRQELGEFKKFLRGAILTLVVAFIGQAGVGGFVLIRMGELFRQVDINTAMQLKFGAKLDNVTAEQNRRQEIIDQAREYIRNHEK